MLQIRKRPAGEGSDKGRHDDVHECTNLIDFAPEIALGHRQCIHHPWPFLDRGLVVFQQVVIVEERLEATIDDQRGQPVRQHIDVRLFEIDSGPFVDQIAQKRNSGAAEAEASILRTHDLVCGSPASASFAPGNGLLGSRRRGRPTHRGVRV